MHKVVKQTREEKIKMYMDCSKEQLAEMLTEANIALEYQLEWRRKAESFTLEDLDKENAKIEATKRIKCVVDNILNEHEKAAKNGRCDECEQPLTNDERNSGQTTCEDCMCPE